MTTVPIRNLASLNRDMTDVVRNILHAVWQYDQEQDATKLVEATRRNANLLLAYLIGSPD
jgi:hypothetical protein